MTRLSFKTSPILFYSNSAKGFDVADAGFRMLQSNLNCWLARVNRLLLFLGFATTSPEGSHSLANAHLTLPRKLEDYNELTLNGLGVQKIWVPGTYVNRIQNWSSILAIPNTRVHSIWICKSASGDNWKRHTNVIKMSRRRSTTLSSQRKLLSDIRTPKCIPIMWLPLYNKTNSKCQWKVE